MKIIRRPSTNFSDRGGWKPDIIVNHITAGSTAAGALATLCSPAREASAHFVVDKDGTVYQLVALDRAAWSNGTRIL
ncbi:N-acetylmuramoyl-L-alanine amidase [Anaeromassilibacillus senegalensis]|uniref:N-acetylmuramoyl-L-alanine amidase n=1 Tax=Anaeromassilibacillus senegalensis TaxID=1673717 RepID=UPI000680A88D|nr:N-acetylmuramoyl-L-alanine amidase [Anaeromassilibacillus senegalensis]